MTPSEAARRSEIRRVGAERFDEVARLLALARRDDPGVVRTLDADRDDVDEGAHIRYWRGFLAGLPPGSEVHATYDADAVAVWVPSETDGAGGWELRALAVAPDRADDGLAELVRRPMLDRLARLGRHPVSRSGRVRIVAGTAGGRRIDVGAGDVRPTSDRVREAVFNALGSLGVVEGARVVDLFAGSGALGIEALSRGAAHATFVDADPAAVATVRVNLDELGFGGRATVRRADATALAAAVSADVALCDPPYEFDAWADLLDGLADAGIGVVVVESDRPVEPGERWVTSKQTRYGGTVVTIARRNVSPAEVDGTPG